MFLLLLIAAILNLYWAVAYGNILCAIVGLAALVCAIVEAANE